MTDAELSRAVAEKLRWRIILETDGGRWGAQNETPGFVTKSVRIPDYATDIGAAMGLVDAFAGSVDITRRNGLRVVGLRDCYAKDTNLPRAVALAWLPLH